jgi:hypothetical protein
LTKDGHIVPNTNRAQTGALSGDRDGGFCSKTGRKVCTASSAKRDPNGLYETSKRHLAERAAARPANAPTPTFMKERAALGKRKLLSKRAWLA